MARCLLVPASEPAFPPRTPARGGACKACLHDRAIPCGQYPRRHLTEGSPAAFANES